MQLVCPACAAKNRVPDERLHDGPQCGRCGAGLVDARPFPLDDTTLQRFIEGSDLPMVVDFWAEWCGPCKMMAPQFATAAAQMPAVRFSKVDTEAAPQAGARHQIRSIPTLVLFHRGREIARRSGALPAAEIQHWVRSALT